MIATLGEVNKNLGRCYVNLHFLGSIRGLSCFFNKFTQLFLFTDVITASSRGLCLTISINMGHNKLLSLFHP